MSAVDNPRVGTQSFEDFQYSIRVWHKGTSAFNVMKVADMAHAAINRVPPINVDGGHISSCTRVGNLATNTTTESNGELWQVDGGIYRLWDRVVCVTSPQAGGGHAPHVGGFPNGAKKVHRFLHTLAFKD